jgi:hypothetical protein
MEFLKKIFGGSGGGSSGTSGDPNGIYFYVKPHGCDEVIRVRVDRNNDLSLSDDGSTYFTHKYARGTKCRQAVEMTLYFSMERQFVNSDIDKGALVEKADYDAWIAAQADSEQQP